MTVIYVLPADLPLITPAEDTVAIFLSAVVYVTLMPSGRPETFIFWDFFFFRSRMSSEISGAKASIVSVNFFPSAMIVSLHLPAPTISRQSPFQQQTFALSQTTLISLYSETPERFRYS